MGVTTLAQFRTRLQTTLGNRGFTDGELDIWINAGVTELAGGLEFEELKGKNTINFVDGTFEYALGTGELAVTAIWIPAEEWRLEKVSAERIYTMRRDYEDIPKYWAVVGTNIVVHPTPDQAYSGYYLSVDDPTALSAAGDTTVYPAGFDNAVHMFAVAHAFFDLDEEQKGTFWLNRATAYAGSRITTDERGAEADSAPVYVSHRSESRNVSGR